MNILCILPFTQLTVVHFCAEKLYIRIIKEIHCVKTIMCRSLITTGNSVMLLLIVITLTKFEVPTYNKFCSFNVFHKSIFILL